MKNEDICCSPQRKIHENGKSCSTSMKRKSASHDSTIWLIYVIVLCHCVWMLLGDIWKRTWGEVSPARLSWAHCRLPHATLRPHRTFPGAMTVVGPNILFQAPNRACVAKNEKSEATGGRLKKKLKWEEIRAAHAVPTYSQVGMGCYQFFFQDKTNILPISFEDWYPHAFKQPEGLAVGWHKSETLCHGCCEPCLPPKKREPNLWGQGGHKMMTSITEMLMTKHL